MKKRTKRWMTWTLATVLGVQVIGAVWWIAFRPGENDLFARRALALTTSPSPGTSFPHAHAALHGATLQVYGRLRVDDRDNAERRGDVRVTLSAHDGQVLETASALYQLSPQLRKGGGDFSVTLPFHPQDASTVHIEWAELPH